MELEDLLARGSPDDESIDRRGGRVSLDAAVDTPAMRAEFRRLLGPLDQMGFWSAAVDEGTYLPARGLWAPQRRAVGLSLAHVAARRTRYGSTGAALIKMPTGTGKTGVIATLACAVPQIARVLVLTPRRALVDQMVRDLHTRLWSRFDAIYDGTEVRARRADDPDVGSAVANGPVWRLLPSAAEQLSQITDPRVVMVGTFSALEQVLRPDRPAHRLSGRRPRGFDAAPPEDEEGDDPSEAARTALVTMLRGFDLVIVDESHYEPAFVWSQCIRSLGRPTLLFSATPYRNDFRYFDIDGRFAFNLSFQEASEKRLIRNVRVDTTPAGEGESFAQRVVRFLGEVGASAMPHAPDEARVIVRAESHDSLIRLREELRRLGQHCVLIHHKETRNNPASLRFANAMQAFDAPETRDVRIWLHQWKLLEGVDDSRFCGVAVMESFSNTRAVIQQIGRVLRYHRRDRSETALVIGDTDIGDDLDDRFERYLGYEERYDADPGDALKRETQFFHTLRDASPAVQYIAGDFRDRFELDEESVGFGDIQLPMRTFVTRSNGALSLDQLAAASAEAMGLEDRHDATVIKPEGDEPTNIRLVAYVEWSNSPLLISKAMPNWTLGIMAIVSVGQRVFLLDTEGLVVDPEQLGLEPEGPETLQRLVPVSTDDEAWRVTVASAVSLDISDMGIRSMSARMRDFSVGFFDLSQGMQATTSVRASMRPKTGPSETRHLSLQRATVSDARAGYVEVTDYVEWINKLADRLDSAIPPSTAFARFAQALPAPDAARAVPQNILFDFAEIIGEDGAVPPVGWDAGRTQALAHSDRCLDVDGNGAFSLEVDGRNFEGKIAYTITGSTRRRGKYVIEIPDLDAFLVNRDREALKQAEKAQLLSGVLSRTQAFRVVPRDPSLVYAQKFFYRPSLAIDVVARDEPGGPLEAIIASPWLAQVTSEKGSATSGLDDWVNESVFGGIYAHFDHAGRGRPDASRRDAIRSVDPGLADLLDAFDVVICDDGGTETCDFLCIDRAGSKVVMIHAKVDDTQMSLNSLQEVGRQAQASLGLLTWIHEFPDRTVLWRSRVPIQHGHLTRRVLRGPRVEDAWPEFRDALRSPRYNREAWIFAGRILSREHFKRQLQRVPPPPKPRQMLYYLASLQTSAARANVSMRIFCSP
ncbi:DEAD/DEAH box helicase [Labrys sp. ZIDIC5]|uniref:DEAD/DEAH box helicase n=1 Tax=Labrys sedimenti TaxID=3106036 RepID=UPI002ACA6624|nr:DEAD/DEAH box helicase family protein [Labrys sp. ZIDIC5]MDZ5454761.1 DEAD/DEAH box helicase family protein [Labrys sp. ZIDIC5]